VKSWSGIAPSRPGLDDTIAVGSVVAGIAGLGELAVGGVEAGAVFALIAASTAAIGSW